MSLSVVCDAFSCLIKHTRGRDDFRVESMNIAEPQPTLMGSVQHLDDAAVWACVDGDNTLRTLDASCIGVGIPEEDEIVERVMKEVEKRLSKRKHISLG